MLTLNETGLLTTIMPNFLEITVASRSWDGHFLWRRPLNIWRDCGDGDCPSVRLHKFLRCSNISNTQCVQSVFLSLGKPSNTPDRKFHTPYQLLYLTSFQWYLRHGLPGLYPRLTRAFPSLWADCFCIDAPRRLVTLLRRVWSASMDARASRLRPTCCRGYWGCMASWTAWWRPC